MTPLGFIIIGIIALSLLPQLRQQVEQTVNGLNKSFTSGAISPIVNAWVEVAVIGAALGFAIWIIEAKTAKSMGQEVMAPGVATIGVAAPPSFGANSGISGGSSGFNATSSTTAHASTGTLGSASGGGGRPISRAAKEKTTPKPAKAGAFTG